MSQHQNIRPDERALRSKRSRPNRRLSRTRSSFQRYISAIVFLSSYMVLTTLVLNEREDAGNDVNIYVLLFGGIAACVVGALIGPILLSLPDRMFLNRSHNDYSDKTKRKSRR